ncbi:MAG: M23 family metallopeptidase [Bacilli bacterium]|nr:M23 family metallopeptidase [Bacilli bacterium]
MKIKDKIIICLISGITGVLLCMYGFVDKYYDNANTAYQVYLNGEKIGLIADKDELYNIINSQQETIKSKYGVDAVYPPNGFNIEKKLTYDEKISDTKSVYNKIADLDDFTIKGYVVTIKATEENDDGEIIPKDIVLNVINKELFEKAIERFVVAFFEDEEMYYNYMNNDQTEIVDTGKIIETMYFEEDITIKEAYISVKEKIYTDEIELSQFLLFGEETEQKKYTVKAGDTITSVAENHQLNAKELLIANPIYTSEENLLAVGDVVNTTLIDPQITFTYEVHSVTDQEQYYEKKTVYDNTKPADFNEITQSGVVGITRLTEKYKVTNGEDSEGIVKIAEEVIIEKVDQITTKGRRNYISGSYIDLGGDWGWPTNSGYRITSGFKWRWGKMHTAIDISGTGRGSPIYSASEGVVVTAENGKGSFWSLGKYVVIKHANNYYTEYAHMDSISVSVGQNVSKGTKIGTMGDTGRSTGVHLHFAVSVGEPYKGGQFFDPLKLYK